MSANTFPHGANWTGRAPRTMADAFGHPVKGGIYEPVDTDADHKAAAWICTVGICVMCALLLAGVL